MHFARTKTMRQLQLFPATHAATNRHERAGQPVARAVFASASRIRYSFELVGTGIMLAGFLVLALLG